MNTTWWRSLFKVSGLIGLSKILGALRDLVISAYFGTSFIADAFNYAALLTSYPFILLGGLNGPFHSATVSNMPNDEINIQQRNIFISKLIFWTLLSFSLLAIIIYFAAPYLLGLFFNNDQQLLSEIILQTKLMLPCLVVTGLIGILLGAMCALGNYSLPALSPLVTSIITILIIVIFADKYSGITLGLGMSLGVIAQVFIQLWGLHLKQFRFVWSLREFFDFSSLKKFNLLLYPALLSSTIGSINVYIDMFFCRDLVEGSWTAVLLGNRLIQLPFGIFVGGALVAFLPAITKLAGDIPAFRNKINSEILNLLLILVPVSAIFLALAKPIIQVILERGAFDIQSTILVSSVLFFLALNLLTSVPREILTRAFYGMGNSRVPFIVSIISILFNILFNYIFVKYWAVGGIALSTTITALCNSLLLILFLGKRFYINYLRLLTLLIFGAICYFLATYNYKLFASLDSLASLNIFPEVINLHVFISCALSTAITFTVYIILVYLFNRKLK